ncbi:hypothetical protein C349_04686 [Cryptococcus neoformans var. grubii Br795]|nr:hypothetical protein C349_04686 [Cryptococcus neoformans var. grubii Br795]
MPPPLNNLNSHNCRHTTTPSSSRDINISSSVGAFGGVQRSPLPSSSSRPLSPLPNLRAFFIPRWPPDIVTPVREPLTSIEGTSSAEALTNLILQDLQVINKGQSHNIPKSFREGDFESHSSLMQALGEHLPQTLGDVAEHENKIDWLTSSLISLLALIKSYQWSLSELKSKVSYLRERLSAVEEAQPDDDHDRPRKKAKSTRSPEVEALVHHSVRVLLGLPPCRAKQNYSPDDWPEYDPILAPNGYYQDAETNAVIWMLNWDNLKCSFYPNLINAAVDICLQDSSMSSMPSREELRKRVKDYLEGIAKMKKRPKEERDANRLLKTIRARVNPLNTWISANFESTPLAHCQESELIRAAFKSEQSFGQRSKSTGRRAPTGQQRYSTYHGNILTVPWGSDSSKLLKVQHRSLWLSIQKHLNPLSYPSPEAVVRLWRCRCEDDSVVYCQMLQRAFKMPVCETLHDWLSAQRTEARSQAEGTSFGRVSDGNEEEDDLSLVDGFYDPESLLETFTQSQDLEPTSI